MNVTVHSIDPDADTIIILRSPGIDYHFALWDGPEQMAEDNAAAALELPFPLDTDSDDSTDTTASAPSPEIEAIEVPSPRDPSATPRIPAGSSLYYVSSRHLTLASRTFESALSGGIWNEGHRKSDGYYYVTADDWEEAPFLLLLDMLHSQSGVLPQSVSLEMMAKIAVLVDYCDCGGAIEIFTNPWLQLLEDGGLPTEYCRKLILLVCIAHVFKKPELFRMTTKRVLAWCTEEKIRTLDLPIPLSVSDALERQRCEKLQNVISGLHNRAWGFLTSVEGGTYRCVVKGQDYSSKCGSMMIEDLVTQVKAAGLAPNPPVALFEGLAIGIYENLLDSRHAGSRRMGRGTSAAWAPGSATMA